MSEKENTEINEEDLVKQLKSAYRKYKTEIYYNNYSPIQRAELAKFEAEKIYNKTTFFEDFAQDIINNNEERFKKILEDISVIALPKKLEVSENSLQKENHNEKNIITNFTDDLVKVERVHYFISLPVEGHILGMLWILREGYILDDKLYKTCYGNRINKLVLDEIKENYKENKFYSDFNPFLFEPYFKKYESWRNDGLNEAESLLKSKQNAIIVSVDLKDYYYRAMVNFKELKKSIERGRKRIFGNQINLSDDDIKLNNELTNFIENIFVNYSKFFKRNWVDENKDFNAPMIPLGFSPSLIISNWHLQGLDQVISEKLHPSFYGRYVDDILVVFPSHEKSRTFGHQHMENMSIDSILSQYFTFDYPEPKISIFEKTKDNKTKDNKTKDNKTKDNKTTVYRLNNQCLCNYMNNDKSSEKIDFNYESLLIQENKIKIFLFSHKNSKAMIDKFKEEIYTNSSEFRFMPETDKLHDKFEKSIYTINYKDSIHKLKDIESFEISKFQLSKMLSQLITDSLYDTDDKFLEKIINNILFSFEGKYLEFLIFWEKLFNILFINNKYKIFKETVLKIIKLTEDIEFSQEHNYNDYGFGLDEKFDAPKRLKESLQKFLYFTCIRVISLRSTHIIKPEINLHKIFKTHSNLDNVSFYEDEDIVSVFNLIVSSLFNNYFSKFPLINISTLIGEMNNKVKIFKDPEHILKIFEDPDIATEYSKDPESISNFIKGLESISGLFKGSEEYRNYDLIKCNIKSFEISEDKDNQIFDKNNYFNGFAFPRYVKFQECILHVIHHYIVNCKNLNTNSFQENYLDLAMKLYKKLNYNSQSDMLIEFSKKCNINCEDDIECPTKTKDYENNSIKHYESSIINVNFHHTDELKIGLTNTSLNSNDFIDRLNGKPNLSSKRLNKLRKIINEAIDKEVQLLLMPEIFVPYEWIEHLVETSRKNQIALIFGVEHKITYKLQDNEKKVGNYLATILPTINKHEHYNCVIGMRLKNHYSHEELDTFRKYDLTPINSNSKRFYSLMIWKGIFIVPYCCFEIANIYDRGIFKNCCDIFTVSEFNKDTLYFNNIAESLSRDLYCYGIKSNTSDFGGTAILQPSPNENKYLVQLKGGENDYIVTHTLKIWKLREDQRKTHGEKYFKPKPPGFDERVARNKYIFKK